MIVFLVPLVAILLSLGGATGWSAARSIQQAVYTEQIGDLGYFATTARQALRSDAAGVFEGEARRFEQVYGIEIAVYDLTGSVWAASESEPGVLSEEEAEQVRLALSGRRAEAPEAFFPWIISDATMVEPVFDDGDVIGAVMISAEVEAPRTAILQQLLILIGVIALGKAFNYWNDATHLSAEGARYAAVNRKPNPANAASLQEQIRLQADTGELRNGGTSDVASASQVCIDFPNGTSLPRDPVRVTMSFTYSWIPLLGVGPSTTITSSTVMAVEAPPTNYTAGCA